MLPRTKRYIQGKPTLSQIVALQTPAPVDQFVRTVTRVLLIGGVHDVCFLFALFQSKPHDDADLEFFEGSGMGNVDDEPSTGECSGVLSVHEKRGLSKPTTIKVAIKVAEMRAGRFGKIASNNGCSEP